MTGDQREKLDMAGLNWCDLDLDGEKGILVDEGVYPQALALLGLREVEERRKATTWDGVMNVTLEPEAAGQKPENSPYDIQLAGLGGSVGEPLVRVLKGLLPELKVNVTIRDLEGNAQAPIKEKSRLNIYLWSAPRGRYLEGKTTPRTLWGDEVDYQRFPFPPSKTGVVILEPNSGWPVAELVGKNDLYIFHNLAYSGSVREARIFKQILDQVLLLRKLSDAALKKQVGYQSITASIWRSETNSDRVITQLREHLAPFTKRDIVLHGRRAETYYPEEDSLFHVVLWGSPQEGASNQAPNRMWGFGVTHRNNAFLPSGRGLAITDQETGWAVGELVEERILYVHHNASYEGGTNEAKILERTFQEAAKLLKMTPKERDAAFLERDREGYITRCMAGRKGEIDKGERVVNQLDDQVKSLQSQLVDAIRKLDLEHGKLQGMRVTESETATYFAKEFNNLLSIPQVRRVESLQDRIFVYTNTLFCTDPRTDIVYEIGEFKIEIQLSGLVRWFNTTRRVDAYLPKMNAPHVQESGEACLGNLKQVLPDLIARYEFSTVAILAIEFVQSVNVVDANEAWGPTITSWPKAKEQPQEKVQGA
ncbi:MAG TPA: hypothetical protein VLA04_05185 [Verrucomicrobiae bacterium]|nr:hypothetical protein [Verrucomicrobiae bacterium]